MADDEIADVERWLRRTVELGECHSVLSVDRLSAAQLADVRALNRRNPIASAFLLRFLVAGLTMSDARDFAETVLRGNVPAAAWRPGPTPYAVAFGPDEQQDTALEPERIPGFRGPDRWYG